METYLVITHGGHVFGEAKFSIAVSDKSPREVLENISKKEPFFGELTVTHESEYDAHGTCLVNLDDGEVVVTKKIRIVVDSSVKTHIV